MTVGENRYTGPYSFASRFEASGDATNPEELVGAAHAGCFSMAFSLILSDAGFEPNSIETTAEVSLKEDPNGGFHIPEITLHTKGDVPGIDAETFKEKAAEAKAGCPVSKLYQGATIKVQAKLS